MTNKKFIIMRGCPGSGKSTIAKQLVGAEGQIFSTDDFWYLNDKKEYQFDVNKLHIAHLWNQRRVLAALYAEIPVVILDNTNVSLSELKSYKKHIEVARAFDYEVSIVEADTPWALDVDELYKRNTHNVPLETIKKMARKYLPNITINDILGIEDSQNQ